MSHRFYLIIVLLSILAGCKKTEPIAGYTRADKGYYYKLLALGDGNDHPHEGAVLVTEAVMRTQADSIFWDTFHDGANGFFISLDNLDMPGNCHEQFLKMVEGDSISFYMHPHVFFKTYFDTLVPPFCAKDTLVRLDVKINQIISKNDYKEMKRISELGATEDRELEELQLIDSYLMSKYNYVKPDQNGIYIIEKTTTAGEPAAYGKKLVVSYKGSFLDGKPIDREAQLMEFTYGTPDQLIEGLNIVIGSLKKGETSKIIVPSRLAFGEKGSSNGSVPPYTPIVYEIKLIDIK